MTVQQWGLALLVVSQITASGGALLAAFNRFWKTAAVFTVLSLAAFAAEVSLGWDAFTW